jgi:HlyD family secretion protein
MQVEGMFNQADSRRVRVGQEALVRLESVPGAEYRGKVSSVGALAVVPGRGQPYLRTIPVKVEILDPDDRLLPHLTASADVLIDKEEDVLLAPAEALHEENGETFVLVQTANGAERRPVTMKRLNGTQVALAGELAEGDVVVIE